MKVARHLICFVLKLKLIHYRSKYAAVVRWSLCPLTLQRGDRGNIGTLLKVQDGHSELLGEKMYISVSHELTWHIHIVLFSQGTLDVKANG